MSFKIQALKVKSLLPTFIYFSIALATPVTSGQAIRHYGEFGIRAGVADYLGDLSPTFNASTMGLHGSAFLGFKLSPAFQMNFGLGWNHVSGADSLFSQNGSRGLSFKSDIYEFNATVALDLMKINSANRNLNSENSPFEFKVSAGLALFHFQPKAYDQVTSSWVKLQPLGTEGQFISGNKGYSLIGIGIQSGLDFQFQISENYYLGFGLSFVKTFTDYLDDVSDKYADYEKLKETGGEIAARMADRHKNANGVWSPIKAGDGRGNPEYDDWYYNFHISLTRKFSW